MVISFAFGALPEVYRNNEVRRRQSVVSAI
jgi:hypothetical protein